VLSLERRLRGRWFVKENGKKVEGERATVGKKKRVVGGEWERKKRKKKKEKERAKTAEHQASKGRLMMANRKNWPRLLS